MGLLIIRGFMKKLFILFMSLVIAAPVFAFSLDKRRHLNFGEFVNVEFVSSQDSKSTAYYFDYIYDLNSRMKDAWNPPTHIKSSKTIYTFDINPKKQTINHINLLRTSGFEDVDRSAMATLRNDVVFKNLPDENYDGSVTLKATFVRSVFGKADVYNNGTVIVMTKDSKKTYAKDIDMASQKRICKKYVKYVNKELKKSFVLSDHPAMYMSTFKFDILKNGRVDNIRVTLTSSGRAFNNDVIKKLSDTKFEPFPPAFLKDKITLEYKVSNHLVKPSIK